jgi:fatty acid desaturase
MNGYDEALELRSLAAKDLRIMIPKPELDRLINLNPKISVAVLALNWGIMVALAAVAVSIGTWVAPIAMILIAGRQHAMLVLMHDASHRLLFSNRLLNDTVSNIFLAFPLFLSTALYRKHHMAHHRFTNTENDPDLADTEIPKNIRRFLLSLGGDLMGMRSLKLLFSIDAFGITAIYKKKNSNIRSVRWERILAILFGIALIMALTLLAGWEIYALYWLAPMWFILPAFLHIRAVAEHAGRTNAEGIGYARSVRANFIERLLICPLNVNLHLEHHLFPKIPFYRLHMVTNALSQQMVPPDHPFRNSGYFLRPNSVLGELYGMRRSTRVV